MACHVHFVFFVSGSGWPVTVARFSSRTDMAIKVIKTMFASATAVMAAYVEFPIHEVQLESFG